MSEDLAIGITTKITNSNLINLKPSYLIYLNDQKYFVVQEKLDIQSNFVLAKGYFINLDEEALNNSTLILKMLENNSFKKEEMYFPWHRILQIKNLIFKSK